MKGAFDIFRELREKTDSVMVGVSRGKDSLAVLDAACALFPRVEAYCMYLVAGLSFVDDFNAYLSARYRVPIHAVPNPHLSHMFRAGIYRASVADVPRLTIRDLQADLRERTGIEWFATGEKACDSLQRRGMMSSLDGIDHRAKVAYPLAWWSDRAVHTYLRAKAIPLPPDYKFASSSFEACFMPRTLAIVAEQFPRDYAKILEVFPLAAAAVAKHRIYGESRVKSSYRRPAPAEDAPAPEVRGGEPAPLDAP